MNKRQYYLKNRYSILSKGQNIEKKKRSKKIKDQKIEYYLNNSEVIKKKQTSYRKLNPKS